MTSDQRQVGQCTPDDNGLLAAFGGGVASTLGVGSAPLTCGGERGSAPLRCGVGGGPSPCVEIALWVTSLAIRPSRIVTRRGATPAMDGSCVISTIVCPCSRLRR